MRDETAERRAQGAARAARSWAAAEAARTGDDVLGAINHRMRRTPLPDGAEHRGSIGRPDQPVRIEHVDGSQRPPRRAWRAALALSAAAIVLITGFVFAAPRLSDDSGDEPIGVDDMPPVSPAPTDPSSSESNNPTASTEPAVTGPAGSAGSVGEARSGVIVGDLVTLGAAPELTELGFAVDAAASRSFVDGLATLETLNDQRRLGDVVVVQLGTNGPIDPAQLDRAASLLVGVPTVVFVTNALPDTYAYRESNNELIRALPQRWPNVSVLDWAVDVDACPGNCLYDDQIHLRPDGQEYFALLVEEATASGPAATTWSPPYAVASEALPAGFRVSTVQARDSSIPPPPLFHGIAHGIADDGTPTTPIVHVLLVDAPTGRDGERTEVDHVAPGAVITRWEEPLANATTITAEVAVPIDEQWVTVSGHEDVDLLTQIAQTAQVADGTVDVRLPDGLVWNPGRSTVGAPADSISYLGPSLAMLHVSTEDTTDGVFVDALRLRWLPEWFEPIDDMPAVAVRDERGLGLIRVQLDDDTIVTIRQSSPHSTGNVLEPWPLDEETMLQLARSIVRLQPTEWDRLRTEYEGPGADDLLVPGREPDQPTDVISDRVQIPVTTDAGPDGTSAAFIAIVPGSSEPRLVVERDPLDDNSRPIGSQLLAGALLDASPSASMGDTTTLVTSVVSASPQAGNVVLTNGDRRMDVELIEAFPDLLPGHRFGYIEVTEAGYELHADHPDAYAIELP